MSKTKFVHGFKPVMIDWLDSQGASGWTPKITPGDLRCVSVGHIVARTKASITLCMNKSPGQTGDHMEIPLCAVKRIRKLKV